jgi:hypothetical protein
MRDVRLLTIPVVLAAAACGPASAPDQPAVAAAQASWCQALAKMNGAGASWDKMGECKGASVTASPAYLRGMAKCFPHSKEMLGDKAPDNTQLLAECRDKVMVDLRVDDAAAQEAIDAHCERANRCEKAAIPECVAAVKRLESSQRAMYYGIYNGRGLHEIASCLKSSACGADEDQAREACYKPISEKLLWFP